MPSVIRGDDNFDSRAVGAMMQQAWADYRQALLDIPQQSGFPHDVVWPTKPEV